MPKTRMPHCVEGRRNHGYGSDGKCKFCGTIRLFYG